jgi:hypothetical protein
LLIAIIGYRLSRQAIKGTRGVAPKPEEGGRKSQPSNASIAMVRLSTFLNTTVITVGIAKNICLKDILNRPSKSRDHRKKLKKNHLKNGIKNTSVRFVCYAINCSIQEEAQPSKRLSKCLKALKKSFSSAQLAHP